MTNFNYDLLKVAKWLILIMTSLKSAKWVILIMTCSKSAKWHVPYTKNMMTVCVSNWYCI